MENMHLYIQGNNNNSAKKRYCAQFQHAVNFFDLNILNVIYFYW